MIDKKQQSAEKTRPNKIKLFYRKNKKKIFIAFRIIISAGLIGYLIKTQFSDFASIIDILKHISIPLLLLSASTHVFGIWITAVRWQALLRTQNVNLSVRYLTSTVLIGFFFNNFLPTSVGGDVYRAYDIKNKGKLPIGSSLSVIVVERFSGIISAVCYLIIALFLGFTAIGTQSIIIPIIIFFVIVVIGALLILHPSVLRIDKLIKKIRFLSKIRESLTNVYHTFLSFKKYKLVLAKVLLFSFSLQFAVILNYFFAARSLGIDLGLTAYIFIVPIVATISMIPISLGGIGIRENTLVFILVSMGVLNEEAAMCSLILFLMLIIIGAIGGITYIIRPFLSKDRQEPKLEPKVENTKTKNN